MKGMRQLSAVFLMVNSMFATGFMLLPSTCDAAPPRAAAPKNTPVDKEQFAQAKLILKDEVVKKDHLILENGGEYEYSGSFRLTQVDDEAAEFKEYLFRVESTLGITIVVESKKSGDVIIIGGGVKVPETKFKSPNIIEFSGRLKSPVYVGESELRLFFVPQKNNPVYILSRLVQVVEPKPAKAE